MPIRQEKLNAIEGYREYQQTSGTTGVSTSSSTGQKAAKVKREKLNAISNYSAGGSIGFDRSGKSRDEYDSGVRQSYAARVSGKLTEGEYNRSADTQQKYGSYQNYLAGATADGKYYSQPELGRDTERLRNTYTTYETATQKAQSAYETAVNRLTEIEEQLEQMSPLLSQLQQYYETSPSQMTEYLYTAKVNEYNSLADEYRELDGDLPGLYSDYERSYGKYSGALDAYNTYQTGEQEKYQSWKGTIRTDEDAINADLTAAQAGVRQLQAQQQELYEQAQQLMNKVSSRQGGTNELMQWSRQAQALREQAKAMDSRIAEAQSAVDLLQEELTWSDYYRYADLKNAPDWAEKSRYKSTKTGEAEWSSWAGTYTDTGYGDILYDYINGDENAQSMQALKDLGGPGTLYATAHDGWKDLPEDVVKIFNYLYAQDTANGDTEHKAAYEYLDKAASRGYTGIEATTYGLLQGTGLASASAALGSTLGDEESKARSDEWYGQFLRDAERAKEEHSAMYTAGSIGGNLLLMYAVGGAAGAAARTLGIGAGALSTQMAMGALSFAGANALQNAGAAATGRMDTDDYLKGIAVSGLQGMAGNLAGGLMSSGMAGLLWYKGLMTPFMEFVRQTASGMTNAAVNQAVGYVAADEKPSSEEIASGLVTAFAFSVLTGAIGTYQTTQTQKANMKAACKVIEQGYRAMLSGTETMTAEAKAQRAQFILEKTQSLRKSMNSYYIAGQQQAVNRLNVALDIIEQSMKNCIAGYNAAPASVLLPGYLLPETAGIGMLPETAGIGMLPETAGIGMLPAPADAPALKMTAPALTQQVEQGLQTAIRQGLTQQTTRQPTQAQTGTLAAAAAQSMAAQPDPAAGVWDAAWDESINKDTAQPGTLAEAIASAQNDGAQAYTERTDAAAADAPAAPALTQQVEQGLQAAIRQGLTRQPTQAQTGTLAAAAAQSMAAQPEAESRTLNNGTIEGGASYGTEQQGYDAADGRTIQLPDGNGGRISGESAGGQSGILAEGRPQRAAEQSRAAVERQNTGRALRLQKVSSRELGLENGTDARTLTVLPEIEWDEGLRRTARRVTRETGKAVTMVLGGIQIRTSGGGIAGARGVYSDTGIILQADNFKLSTDQIADHEIFHDYADSTPGLIQSVEQAIVERYGREEFDKILTTYIQKLRGVIDLPKNAAEAEIGDALLDVKNEVFADAYAGINAFGAHAEKYRDTTRQTLAERGVIASRENAAATDRRRGPPERFSVEETDDGRAVAVVDNDILSHIDTSAWDDTKKAQAKAAAKTALLAFKDGIQVNGITYKVNKTARDEFTRSNDTERLYRRQPETFADKMRAADVVDDIITATTSWANDGMLKHPRTDNFVDFVHGDVLIQAGGNQYDAKTVVGITANGEYVFYDVVDMTPTAFQMKEEPSTAAAGKNAASAIQESSSKDRVAQTGADVKREDEEEMPTQPDPAAGVWDAAWDESANKNTAQSGTLAEAIASAQNDGAQMYTERTDAAGADAPAAPALKMTAPALTQQVEQGLQTAIRQGLTQQAATDRRTGPSERNEMQNTAASFRKTAVNDDPGQHTAAEQRLIEEYKAGADRNLAAFIQQVRGLQNRNYKNGIRQTIATQTDNAVRKALELTGVNTSGYKNIINGSSVQHIDKRHGADGTADHSMANIEDFARIGFVLDNFTDARVLRASETDQETARLARGWRNSDNTYAPLVQFSMPVNGTYYVVEAVPSSKAHVMAVISAYMSSDAKKQQHPQSSAETAGVPTASVTSETPHELLDAVGNTVPQRGNAVKRMPLAQPDPAAGVWDAAWDESINKNTARRGIAEGEPNAASPDGAALSDAQMPAQQELEVPARTAAADTGEAQIRTAETVADEIAAQLDPAAGEIAAQPGTLAEAIASAQLELETSAEISSDTYLDQDKQFVEDPFDENGDLKKNVRYRSGDFKNYAYETDELGRIIKAVADDLRLKLSKGRYRHDPNSPGKELGDEAGHLFADMFGGSPLKDNIVSQLKKVNRSDWAALEQAWKKALLNGQEVRVAIDVLYSGNSLRPDGFMVQYTIDGVQHSAVKLTISNI